MQHVFIIPHTDIHLKPDKIEPNRERDSALSSEKKAAKKHLRMRVGDAYKQIPAVACMGWTGCFRASLKNVDYFACGDRNGLVRRASKADAAHQALRAPALRVLLLCLARILTLCARKQRGLPNWTYLITFSIIHFRVKISMKTEK